MQLQYIKHNGSEFDVVIMVVPPSSSMLLTRNLLYTGLTRAKKLLILISQDKIIQFMINNSDTKKRNTGLVYKLKNINGG
jgi:exodeoxyribonuclease V alpha subunit